MGILSTIFGQRPSASPDSITFDVSRYEFQGDRDGARVWFLPEGGGVGLYGPRMCRFGSRCPLSGDIECGASSEQRLERP